MKKLMLMALVALVSVFTFSSCSSDDEGDGFEWYVTLDAVSTNLQDANGNSMEKALYDAFVFDNGQKYMSIGKQIDTPYTAFENACAQLQSALQQELASQLPSGGTIHYVLSLRQDSPQGDWKEQYTVVVQAQ